MLCALGAAFTWHRASQRWAVPATVVMVLGIATVQFWAIALAARDIDVLVTPIVIVMMAATLLYPWGVGPQVLVATYVAAGYLLLPDWATLDAMRTTNIIIGVTLGVGTSVCGSLVLDRQRRATFAERERVAALAHQRELLLDAGRQLSGTLDLEELEALITRLAQRVVDSDVVTLTLVEEGLQERYRVVSAARERPDVQEHEIPVRGIPAFRDAVLQRRVIEIPGGTEFDELKHLGAAYGVGRFLVVGLQRHERLLAVLAFNQRMREPPFGEQRIRLAEGIAHQAATALANARLVDDLQRASRVKSDFVSTMSHELRTPLNVILGFAEIGRDPAVGEPERTECFAKIDTAGRDLLELIESTLAIGKLEAARDAVQPEPVALPEFWTTLGTTCERMPRRPSVALKWANDVPAVSLHTDPRKLTILLRNLVNNAFKFTEAGHVRAGVELGDDTVAFTVADTGIGIRLEDQGAIFEIFRQADGSDSRRFGGTGLGLYIVQRYVQQLGGTIALESMPGRGATFTVRLPLEVTAGLHAG